MGYTTFWKRFGPRQLNIFIQLFSLISIFFEGYDQGVMGGVNTSPNYVTEVGIGLPDGTVTDTTHQGGIVSIVRLHTFRDSAPLSPSLLLRSLLLRSLLYRPLLRRSPSVPP